MSSPAARATASTSTAPSGRITSLPLRTTRRPARPATIWAARPRSGTTRPCRGVRPFLYGLPSCQRRHRAGTRPLHGLPPRQADGGHPRHEDCGTCQVRRLPSGMLRRGHEGLHKLPSLYGQPASCPASGQPVDVNPGDATARSATETSRPRSSSPTAWRPSTATA